MIFNYYSKLKQLLQQDNHDLDLATNDQFIRIIPSEKKWEDDQWKEYVQNVDFQYMDRHEVLSQLKKNFDPSLRSIIYPWIANKTVPPPIDYKLFAQNPCAQDNIIFRDIERTHSHLQFYKSKRKSSKKHVQRASQQLDSIKSIIDEKILNDFFSLNQRRLFYLLRAYANQDPSIGYVQGMNYIMGLLLFLLDDSNSLFSGEMKAYQMFLFINIKMNWSQTYNKSMKKLKSMVQHLQFLLQQNLPDIYKIICNLDQPFIFFMDQYFFGLMSYKTPIEFSAKILDIFIIQGEQIIFDVLLRVFTLNRNEIKQLSDKDEQTQFIKDILPMSIEKFGIQALIPNSEIII
ncbi:unnamed protein product [Paramecium pentaurelia]|uniref:Rab-GAP TBC domain-containing protein n=1 Tax=Paramecium pentaurelia TaxID=43138 RepID=A0A8S1USB3_9CILI|nr:unnamed protein product [Paramecium pentaurelia]